MPIESADPQRSLGDYVAGDPLADVELPERSVEWRAEPVTTPEGFQILSFDGRFEYPDGYLGSNVAGFVIGDVDEYLAEYGGDELSIRHRTRTSTNSTRTSRRYPVPDRATASGSQPTA